MSTVQAPSCPKPSLTPRPVPAVPSFLMCMQLLQVALNLLEKTLESPLVCKEIQPVHSKGDQPWDFFGRNDAEGETPVLWPPHAKS